MSLTLADKRELLISHMTLYLVRQNILLNNISKKKNLISEKISQILFLKLQVISELNKIESSYLNTS